MLKKCSNRHAPPCCITRFGPALIPASCSGYRYTVSSNAIQYIMQCHTGCITNTATTLCITPDPVYFTTIRGFRQRDKTRCASFISLSRRSPHTNTSHSAAAYCSRKLKQARGILSPRLIWILLYMWKWGLVVDQLVLIVPAVQLADLSSDLL